jgi:carbohydrate kinase (thermoresistant glucokinase family)
MTPSVLIVMGVSGVGKSTIALSLNTHLHWPFQEGDDLHPAANIEKMSHGIPLTDADRAPWLAAVRAWIDARLTASEPGLITCSALKRSYRTTMVANRANVRILYLHADPAVIEEHLARRTGHFMPPTMLESQLRTLEEPAPDEHPITVNVTGSIDDTVADILQKLKESNVLF